jgi:hypothetical protein
MMTVAVLQSSVVELQVVFERTIQYILQKHLKMLSCVVTMKLLLTGKKEGLKAKFSQAYRHFTAKEDWSKVMYSNESTFKCIKASRAKVRRPKGASRYDIGYTVKTVELPDNVMVWGCFPAM